MQRLESHGSFRERISAFKTADDDSGNGGQPNRTDLRGKVAGLNIRRDGRDLEAGIDVGAGLEATIYFFSTDGQSVKPSRRRHRQCLALSFVQLECHA